MEHGGVQGHLGARRHGPMPVVSGHRTAHVGGPGRGPPEAALATAKGVPVSAPLCRPWCHPGRVTGVLRCSSDVVALQPHLQQSQSPRPVRASGVAPGGGRGRQLLRKIGAERPRFLAPRAWSTSRTIETMGSSRRVSVGTEKCPSGRSTTRPSDLSGPDPSRFLCRNGRSAPAAGTPRPAPPGPGPGTARWCSAHEPWSCCPSVRPDEQGTAARSGRTVTYRCGSPDRSPVGARAGRNSPDG